jgi:hypothetical protein
LKKGNYFIVWGLNNSDNGSKYLFMSRKKSMPLPPCPDHELYTLVKLKDRYTWRRKRGSLTPIQLNSSFQKNVELTPISNAAASRIFAMLDPFVRGLSIGRAQAQISGMFKKAMNARGRMDFGFFEGFDFQKDHPFESLVRIPVDVKCKKESVSVSIIISPQTIKQYSKLVSGYYFEAILLYGDAGKEGGLSVETVTSRLYDFKENGKCQLELGLPLETVPWMLLIKASCLEGNELAVHPRHYGMKVIKTGEKAVCSL